MLFKLILKYRHQLMAYFPVLQDYRVTVNASGRTVLRLQIRLADGSVEDLHLFEYADPDDYATAGGKLYAFAASLHPGLPVSAMQYFHRHYGSKTFRGFWLPYMESAKAVGIVEPKPEPSVAGICQGGMLAP